MRVELVRVPLGACVDEYVSSLLRDACRLAAPFSLAPAVYIASNERRAKRVSRLSGEAFPEGTPERVSRELLKLFAPQLRLRGEVERDFDFFGALSETLNELGENRRTGRALVDELLTAWKRLAQVFQLESRDAESLSWVSAMGRRGELFGGVIKRYRKRLVETGSHDPEDAAWLVPAHVSINPQLVIIDDLERITPAREALLRHLCASAERTVIIARGIRGLGDELEYTSAAHDILQGVTNEFGGEIIEERTDWPLLTHASVSRDWLEDASVGPQAVTVLRPPSRAAEVSEAARAIKRAANDGVALSEICIAMPSPSAYRELIEETFGAGGIPFDAPFEIPLDETPIVAALFDLIRVARNDVSRTELLDALASPFLPFDAADDAREKRLREIEVVTRKAWVVGGRDVAKHWIAKLDAEGGENWAAIREPVVAILDAIRPFTKRATKAVRFFDAVTNLVQQSGAVRVAAADRKAGVAGAGLREEALHQFRVLIRGMREEFRRIGDPELTMSELLRALTEQSRTRGVRPPERGLERVRVLGLRELRGVQFRRVIVLGLTDQDLPLGEEETLFLPSSMESALKPLIGDRAAATLCVPIDVTLQADYLFAHTILAASETLTLCLPAASGDTPFVPATPLARLMRSMGVNQPDDLPEYVDGNPPTSMYELGARAGAALANAERGAKPEHELKLNAPSQLNGLRGRRLELARTDLASAPGDYEGVVGELPKLEQRFAPNGEDRHLFSPSQLDNYAECPMRFWARYIVKAKAPDEPTLDTKPHAIGTLLHAVLEQWALLLRRAAGQPDVLDDPVQRQPVKLAELADSPDDARDLGQRLMCEAFDIACAGNPSEGPFWQGVKNLVAAGLPGHQEIGLGVGLLSRFVDFELARNAEGHGIRFVEFDFGKEDPPEPSRPDVVNDCIEIAVEGGTMKLMGSVDRVDESAQGLTIIDYKTGKTKSGAAIRDGKAFQLPAYLAAISKLAERAPQGMAYVKVPAEGAPKYDDATTYYKKPAYDVSELVFTKLPERLGRMMNAMRGGVFMHLPFKVAGNPCRYCDYATSCARRMDVIEERQHRLPATSEVPDVYLPDGEAK